MFLLQKMFIFKWNELENAQKLFEEMPKRDVSQIQ